MFQDLATALPKTDEHLAIPRAPVGSASFANDPRIDLSGAGSHAGANRSCC